MVSRGSIHIHKNVIKGIHEFTISQIFTLYLRGFFLTFTYHSIILKVFLWK